MDYLRTINHDLHGISKLLLFSQNNNFSSVAVHSLFRDSCLMLYEIIKVLKSEGILKDEIPIYEIIEPIRHKVKSSQGRDNREILGNILKTHFNLFGEDIDNLGFYLENDEVIGSTIYVTYVYDGTPFFNSKDTGKVILEFSREIGRSIAEIINAIQQPLLIPTRDILSANDLDYELKDVWHKRFFTDDITLNVCLMRLLVIQNEISSCLWVEKYLDYKTNEFTLDKYLLLRLSSIKFYQTMENLMDIEKRAPKQFSFLGLNDLDRLILRYKNELRAECKFLRNLLHYSNHQINYFDYVVDKIEKNNDYADMLLQTILLDFFPLIKEKISKALNISSIESMSDWEKIKRRIGTKFKSTIKRNS